MALSLLDGTDSAVDVIVTFPASTNTASLRCMVTGFSYDITRSFQDATTLCSGQDVSELPGRRQAILSVGRLNSQGTTGSDLSSLMGATAATALTVKFSSGCYETGTFWLGQEGMTVQAAQIAQPGNLAFRSSGSRARTWVTT